MTPSGRCTPAAGCWTVRPMSTSSSTLTTCLSPALAQSPGEATPTGGNHCATMNLSTLRLDPGQASAAESRARDWLQDIAPGAFVDDAVRRGLAGVQPRGRDRRPVDRIIAPEALVTEIGDPADRQDRDKGRDRGDGLQPDLPVADKRVDRDDRGRVNEENRERRVPGTMLDALRDGQWG